MIDNNQLASVLTSRVNILDEAVARLSSAVERLAMQVAIGGVPKEGKSEFLTIEEQARGYLLSSVPSEKLAIVKGKARDESSSALRGQVICDLYSKGISANMISRLINKDHNCIFYHLAMNNMIDWRNSKQIQHRMASKKARQKRKNRLAKIRLGNF